MKKLIFAVVLLGLVGYGAWTAWKPKVPPTQPAGENKPAQNELVTYTDSQGVFSFVYPADFRVTGRYKENLATVKTPKAYLSGTNFSEAVLTIAFSNTPAALAACSGRKATGDAGAGNFYETTSVKKVFDGDCYTFAYTIHSTNIGNYDPSQGIKEFNKAKIVSEMEGIIASFQYLVNSD